MTPMYKVQDGRVMFPRIPPGVVIGMLMLSVLGFMLALSWNDAFMISMKAIVGDGSSISPAAVAWISTAVISTVVLLSALAIYHCLYKSTNWKPDCHVDVPYSRATRADGGAQRPPEARAPYGGPLRRSG